MRLAEPDDLAASKVNSAYRESEEQDYGALKGIALERDVSLSWVVGQTVKKFIERKHDKNGIMGTVSRTR